MKKQFEMKLDNIIRDYLYNSDTYWPEVDARFHKRSRKKIANAKALYKGAREDIISTVIANLKKRYARKTPSLYIVSNGESGCHFIGNMIGNCDRYQCIQEVYYPEKLLNKITECKTEFEKFFLAELVNYISLGSLNERSIDLIPINILHLRSDCNTHLLKECLPWARFVLLVRNPYDISVLRTFRKNDYRQMAAPGVGDLDYLSIQCNNVSKFYGELHNHHFDFVTRYENFVSDPVDHVNDMLMSLELPNDIGQLKTASALYCNEYRIENKSVNLNRKPQTGISGKAADIMVNNFSSIASEWGYHIPDYISPRGGSSPVSFWRPKESLSNEAFLAEGLADGQVKVHPYMPPFKLSELESWDAFSVENKTKSWRLYFYSLCWLYRLENDFKRGEFEEFYNVLERLIYDFIPFSNSSKIKEVWDDHATAYRAAVLTYFYHTYLAERATQEQAMLVQASIRKHADILEGFIESNRWSGNNHAVFHAQSLINLSSQRGFFDPRDEAWLKKLGVSHLRKSLKEIIDLETGVSREQSFHYHVWTVPLLKEVAKFAKDFSIDIGIDLDQVLKKMLSFAELLVSDVSCVPAIGDTPHDASYNQTHITKMKTEIPESQWQKFVNPYVVKKGLNSYLVDNDGCLVIREASKKTDGLVVFLPKANWLSHGHHDYLSFVFSINGNWILTDSGGPYAYGSEIRQSYFTQNLAHNTLVVDGKPYTDGAILKEYIKSDKYILSWGYIENNNGVRHDRCLVYIKGGGIVCIDGFKTLDGKEHDAELLFHFVPAMKLRADAHRLILKSIPELGMEMRFLGQAFGELQIVQGLKDPYQGWITPNQNEKVAAPVLRLPLKGPEGIVVTLIHGKTMNIDATIDGENIVLSSKQLDAPLTITFPDYGNGVKQP